MADAQDVVNKIEEFRGDFQPLLDELDAAKSGAESAALAALAAAGTTKNISASVSICIDAVNGDDINDGLTAQTCVKTWARVCGLLERGVQNIIFAYSDFVMDTAHTISSPPDRIYFRGFDQGGIEAQRKITIVDATNNSILAGGLYSNCSYDLSLRKIDIELAAARSHSPFYGVAGRIEFNASVGTLTRTGTGAGPLLRADSMHLHLLGFVIDPTASGYLALGLATGVDPNTVNGISSNLTTN